jgi:hypothetical protein
VIKAFDRSQFSIIEALYMRPGYTILLEWGHTSYIDNNGDVVSNNTLLDGFFNNSVDKQELYQQILKKQEDSNGNYDAFLGPIINFNSTMNPDGSYSISLKAISWGAIVESLKINASTRSSPSLEDLVVNTIKGKKEDTNKDNKDKNEDDNENKVPSQLEYIFDSILKCQSSNITDDNKSIPHSLVTDIKDKKEWAAKIIPNVSDEKIIEELINFVVAPFHIDNQENDNSPTSQIYIPLRTVLAIIDSYISKISENRINYDFEENLCYTMPYHLSINPYVCLIKYEEIRKDFKLYNNSPDTTKFTITLEDDLSYKRLNRLLPAYKKSGDEKKAHTMNIMVNVGHVLNIFKNTSSSTSNNEVTLLSFLETLMNDISQALGGVNEFNVALEDDTVYISDTQNLQKGEQEPTVIPSYGIKSIVHDISITSEISTNMANMIAIGAQATSTNQGKDVSFLTQYNEGLTDRVKSSSSPTTQSLSDIVNDSKTIFESKGYDLVVDTFYTIINKFSLESESFTSAYPAYRDLLNVVKSNTNPGLNIIPFKFKIKMDGISGIKYGQIFSIEPERMPKNWLDGKNNPSLTFLVTDISHELNNTWTTSIGGQASPWRNKDNESSVPIEKFLDTKKEEKPFIEGSSEGKDLITSINAYYMLIKELQFLLANNKAEIAEHHSIYKIWEDGKVGVVTEFANSKKVAARLNLLFGYKSRQQYINQGNEDYIYVDSLKVRKVIENNSKYQNYKIELNKNKTLRDQFNYNFKKIIEKLQLTTIDGFKYEWEHPKFLPSTLNPRDIIDNYNNSFGDIQDENINGKKSILLYEGDKNFFNSRGISLISVGFHPFTLQPIVTTTNLFGFGF